MKKIFIFFIIQTLFVLALDVKTYIPTKAQTYLPIMYETVDDVFDEFPLPPYFGALIEHESCIGLRHSRCWSPTSELHTKREQGVGLGQITRTWRKNGRLRFDTLYEIKRRYPKMLKDLTGANIKTRPDLQIKAIVLMWKRTYNKLPNTIDFYNKMAMTDSAYNGGYTAILKDRKYCGLKKNCNPNIWFGNLEKYSKKSRRKLYGNRSAYDINRHHVKDVLEVRMFKYIDHWIYHYKF